MYYLLIVKQETPFPKLEIMFRTDYYQSISIIIDQQIH